MISTYAELKTAVANWMHRSDLTDRIPEFISMGESYLNGRLRLRDMRETADITPSMSDSYVSLPASWMETISFTDDLGSTLRESTPEEMALHQPSAGRPRLYRITDRIDFERVSDASYTFKMTYLKRLNIEADNTNSVLTNWPGLYLYSALLQAVPYIKDDARIGGLSSLLNEQISIANRQSSRNTATLRTEFINQTFDIVGR